MREARGEARHIEKPCAKIRALGELGAEALQGNDLRNVSNAALLRDIEASQASITGNADDAIVPDRVADLRLLLNSGVCSSSHAVS
jgi:hypothetical protein